MRLFYSFLCFVLLLLADGSVQASPSTLILSGNSKFDHLAEFLDEIPENLIITPDDKTLILSRQSVEIFNDDGFETIGSLKFTNGKNFSTIVLTNEEDLEHVIRTQRNLQVLDFDKSPTVSILLSKCQASTENQDYNTFICESLHFASEQPSIAHYSFFASAAKSEKKIKKVVKVESAEDDDDDDEENDIEDEIQVIVEKKMKEVEKRKKEKVDDDDDDDDDDNENEYDNKHDPKRDHRLHCKYRKTCYETGKRGLIEPFDFSFDHLFHFWRAPASQQHHLSKHEDADQDGIPDSEDEDVNLADRKLVCKYRTACYKDHNIPLTDKQQERERSFISAKLQVPHGKKRTLKDIANKAIEDVEEREEQVKHRPVPKSMIVEKKLKEIEDHLQKKLDCKYRKSCYETGELPEIDETISIPFLYSLSASNSDDHDDDDKEQKSFEEMEDLERKHYCKYRKSCYESGVLPDIDPEIQVESIRDILDATEQVETRKLSLQERCKYRKSCYETGILPDLSRDEEYFEKVAQKEVSAVVPSTLSDLKTLCKYRKSCYQEIAVADSSNDVVESIRKRRIIEKEVRKRRTRRQKHLNKRKAMMARYGLRTVYEPVEKTKEELKKLEEKREIRKQAPPSKVIKREIKKKEPVKKTKSRVAEVVEDIAEAVVAKKIAEALSEQDDDDDDDDDDEVKEIPTKKASKSKKEQEEEEKPKSKKSPVKKIQVEQEVKKVVKKIEAAKIDSEEDDEPENDSEEDPKVKKSPVKAAPVPAQKPKKSPVKKIEDSEEDENPAVKKVVKQAEASKDDSEEDEPPVKKIEKPHVKVVPVPVPVPVQKSKKAPVKKIEDSEEDEPEEKKAPVQKSKTAPSKKIEDSEEDEPEQKKTPVQQSKKASAKKIEDKPAPKVKNIEEPKAKKVIVKQAQAKKKDDDDDDDEDGNEFDNKHDPKRDHRLHCKYRKTCYETGKRGLIEPFDFSFDHMFHLWRAPLSQQHHNFGRDSDGDGIPDSEDTDTHISHRKLACKYRPSCYEKFDIPVSENIVEREQKRSLKSEDVKPSKDSDEDDDDDHDDEKEVSKSDKKLECKYRKSCYESGVLPKIQEWNDAPKHSAHNTKSAKKVVDDDDDNDDDDDDEQISKSDKKLECKYRKSCYDSGVLPTIQQWSVEPQIVESLPSASVKDHKLQKCKYRKSCYEEMGIHEKDEEDAKIVEKEEERKPQLKKQPAVHGKEHDKQQQQQQHKHQKQHQKKEKKADSEEDGDGDDDSGEKDDNDDDDEVKTVKKVIKEVERQDDVNDMETEIAREIHLSNQEKYICKYRRSCYSTVEPKAAKQDHSGNMARRAGSGEKCHIYYLSCREQMGLPPKEKAPMGPNGKKLCRKVKKTSE